MAERALQYAAGQCAIWGIVLESLAERLFGWFPKTLDNLAQAALCLRMQAVIPPHSEFPTRKVEKHRWCKATLIVLRKCEARRGSTNRKPTPMHLEIAEWNRSIGIVVPLD